MEQDVVDGGNGANDSGRRKGSKDSSGKKGGSKEKVKSATSFQGSLSSLLRSRGHKSSQRVPQQESPGGTRATLSHGGGAVQVGAGSEEEPDFDGDEDMHEPKHEEQDIQINSPMHAPKESRVNLSKKNSNMGAMVDYNMKDTEADVGGDGENVDDSYQDEVDMSRGADRMLNPSAPKRGVGGLDSEPDSGLSPRHSKVPQSQKTQQKIHKDSTKSNQKPS